MTTVPRDARPPTRARGGRSRDGAIDTVLVAFPDLQGRLVGKRVTGHYWAEQMQGGHRAAAHVQLPARGRRRDERAARLPVRELGAGLRRHRRAARPRDDPPHPVARRDRARAVRPRRRGDRRAGRGLAPPHPATPGRARRRASGFTVLFARELEFFLFRESLDEAAAKDYTNLTPHSLVIEDYHILQTTRDEYVIRAIRNGDRRRGRARRVLEGRGGQGPARDQPRVLDRGRDGRPARRSTRTARRRSRRSTAASITFMAKYSVRRGRLVVPRALEPVGRRRAATPLMWDADAPDHLSPAFRGWLGGQLACGRELAWMYAPDRQLLQALPARVVGADRARVERRQPHVRVPHRRPRRVVPPRVAHPRRRREPVPRVRGHDRGRPARHRARHRPAPALRRQRVRGRRARARARRASPRRSTRSRRSKVAADAFGADVHDHLLNTARQELAHFNRAVTDWERRRNFDQW